MEAKLFWKSVIRRKGSLLMLMILMITASFGFMLRTVEYLAVSREIDRISQEYQPIGTLSSPDGIVTEGVPLVEESPYVEFIDINRACPAILSDIYNADLDGTAGLTFGEFGVKVNEWMVWGEVEAEMEVADKPKIKRYLFRVKEGICGYPEYTEPEMTLILQAEGEQIPQMEEGKTYLVRVYLDSLVNDRYYGDRMIVGMRPLEEGVWFLEGEPDEEISGKYLDEDAALQERNRHAMLAYSTVDMSSMPWAQESSKYFYLEEGRWLNRQDQEEGRMVCVVMKRFAEIRGLGVGDTLTMTLQDKKLSFYGYSSSDNDTWETDDKTEVTLEIVGIYGNLYGGTVNNPGWVSLTYQDTTVLYLPNSCMPEHYAEDSDIWQNCFSFVLKDPEDKDVFLAEMTEKLEPLGISISFLENNWDSFYPSAKAIRQGAFYSFRLFMIVLALVLGTVAFLYTWQRKKETAIARAIGVPAKKTAFCACLPMMAFGAVGILVGGTLGWEYGLVQAGKTLASLDADSQAELPLIWLAGICLLVWLLLTMILLVWNLSYSQKSVLEILQGTAAGRQNKRIRAGTDRGLEEDGKFDVFQEKETDRKPDVFRERAVRRTGETNTLTGGIGTAAAKKMSLTAALRFTGRHLGRFSLRSVCALLVAAVFTTASCCLREFIRTGEQEVEHLYSSTIVEMDIGKKDTTALVTGYGGAYIKDRTVQELLDTGNILESYLVAGAEGEIGKLDDEEREATVFFGIDDVEQYFASGPWDSVEIYYRDGYGAELFGKDYEVNNRSGSSQETPVIILPEEMWTQWESDLEDTFCIKIEKVVVTVEIGGYYKNTSLFVSGNDKAPLLPLSVLEQLEGENLYYGTVQFTLDPEKNRELKDFREKSQEIIEAPGAGLQELSLIILDGELKQAVEPIEKNISLMKILYPLANAVAFLAAVGLSILFLFQRRREAAILRVLGVGTLPTRLILTLELLVVNAAGILLGTSGTAILTESGLSAMPFAAGCYFLGCLIGTVAGAVMITRGKPLELLQDKE